MKKIILIVLLIIVAIFTVRTSYVYSAKQVAIGTSISASSSLPLLQRNLQIGDSGSDVSLLQSFLVQQGFMNDAPTGYYGSSTYVGVSGFQLSKSITPVTGEVSILTRLAINEILATATTTPPNPTPTRLTQNFFPGDNHPEIGMVLKVFLEKKGYLVLGEGWDDVYVATTQQAVIAFKRSQGISPYDATINVLVRNSINSILDQGTVVSTTTDPTVDPSIEGCGKGVTVGTTVFKLENCTISSNGQDVVIRIVPSDLSAVYSYKSLIAGFPKQGLLASAEGTSKQGVVTIQIPLRDFGIPTVSKKTKKYLGFAKIRVSLDGKKHAPKFLYQKILVTIRP